MFRLTGALILIFTYSFSQENLKTHNNISEKKPHFDEKRVKTQIDSLNRMTPIDLIYNKEVGQQIKFYLFKKPNQVSRLLALSEYYFPVFEETLDKNNLPLELKYLPIIESALNPNARSYAGAVGLWQFMYLTAKEYGLRINTYLDERKELYKSTQAACRYLEKAYAKFNNWELALASYNAGARNVTKAMRRSGGKNNYWELRPFLPKETQNYIPSFIAAIYVMNFASDYNIQADTNYTIKQELIDSIYLKRSIKMEHLAELLDMETSTIEGLNPVYRTKLIPFLEQEKFAIFLPQEKVDTFLTIEESVYMALDEMELAEKLEYPPFTEIEKIKYTVKRGDFLGKIANKYNCSIKDIMLWNDLKTHKIYAGKRLSIYKTVK